VIEPVHPTLDELAELRAGVLGAERQAEVSAHLASCDDCAQASAALSEVENVLTTAGSAPIPMPADRSASLHDALRRASAERAAAVASLTDHRDRSQRHHPAASGRRIPRWVSAAGAAAAVVLACYGGINLLHSGGVSESDSSSADAGGSSAGGRAGQSRQSPGAPSSRPLTSSQTPGKAGGGTTPVVTPRTLPRYATSLAGTDVAAARPTCGSAVHTPGRSRSATIRWKGARALVVVDITRHRATVYSCGDAAALFSTRY
jgi:hypothetical protein